MPVSGIGKGLGNQHGLGAAVTQEPQHRPVLPVAELLGDIAEVIHPEHDDGKLGPLEPIHNALGLRLEAGAGEAVQVGVHGSEGLYFSVRADAVHNGKGQKAQEHQAQKGHGAPNGIEHLAAGAVKLGHLI